MLRSGATSFYHDDGVGTITSLANTVGSLAETYTFDSFGKQTASSGSLTNPFQYTGREFDSETSLYYYRARYYDPGIGRFISEDPSGVEGGMNLFAYTDNNPLMWADPFGLHRSCRGVPRGMR
jgi:RHS repeat-associated protein